MTASTVNTEADVPDPSQTPATLVAVAPPIVPTGPAALLRGSAKGLEIVVDGRAELAEIVSVLTARLGEAPGFFKGSDVRVRVDHGPLPAGALSRLDEIATVFELRIVEVGALVTPKAKAADDAVPHPNLAAGSAPAAAEPFQAEESTLTRAPLGLPADELLASARAATVDLRGPDAATDIDADADTVIPGSAEPGEPALSRAITKELPILAAVPKITVEDEPPVESPTTRVVVGPVRSGVILDHPGHLIVFGDVNPGAEVRAEGNIVVLGRLRGTAHAGIGNDSGFILALRLEPQQLRICRQVARAGDSDTPGTEAEIAYVTDASIVVERYAGRLPKNLAASI